MIATTTIVQEVAKKVGKMTDVAYKSTYNPKTKKYFGFPDNYVPDPVVWRHDLWYNVGDRPEHVGPRPQGGAEAEDDRPPDRDRAVERARLEHGADRVPDVLRLVAPEREQPADDQHEGHDRRP